jgi:hypothetical protein
MLDAAADRVAAGATAELRPSGSSMVPLIRSRQRVIVVPADPAKREVGDIRRAQQAIGRKKTILSALPTLTSLPKEMRRH